MRHIIFGFLLLVSGFAVAEDVMTVRSNLAFSDGLTKLQNLILNDQYKVTIIQRCDFGLKESGLKTDKYRVVFFGKFAEVKAISDAYPELSPFLPPRILIAEENGESVLSALSPSLFLETVKEPALVAIVQGWQKDITDILQEMKK